MSEPSIQQHHLGHTHRDALSLGANRSQGSESYSVGGEAPSALLSIDAAGAPALASVAWRPRGPRESILSSICVSLPCPLPSLGLSSQGLDSTPHHAGKLWRTSKDMLNH